MAIVWFPGHMARTRREIKENLKLVDAVIEIRDARIVKSSANPEIETICKDKPRIILLNKSDLCDERITKQWISKLSSDKISLLGVNCLTGNGLKEIKPSLDKLLKEKQDRQRAKGVVNVITRVMVVGIPNVGKSSFINKMAQNAIAKVADRPGVTRSKQWIKTKIGIELMDTPGVLWPKFEDEETGFNLAFTGAIKDEIMDVEELAFKLIERLQVYYSKRLIERYKIEKIYEDPIETIKAIARKRGAIVTGGEIDFNRISVMLLDEFRGGKLGPISLERPETKVEIISVEGQTGDSEKGN